MERQRKIQEDRWLLAEAAENRKGRTLSEDLVSRWRNQGAILVSGVIPEELAVRLYRSACAHFPEPGSNDATGYTQFGADLCFPSESDGLNEVTLHPAIMGAVAELLGATVTDLRLTQSDVWPKYAREHGPASDQDNADQRIHVDYPNHTLAHPTEWSRPEAVEMIVYLGDEEQCGGATAVVLREGEDDPAYRWPMVDTPGVGDLDYVNDRSAAEEYFARQRPALAGWRSELYRRERYVRYRRGDVLFYRHDTWHRGTPLKPGALRLAHNITYRRAESEWISHLHVGWSWSAYRKSKLLERLIASATLEQRAVLGFPQPGSAYWTEATIDAVEARHGVFGMDMTPYRQALDPRG